jgi:hypothetical protein
MRESSGAKAALAAVEGVALPACGMALFQLVKIDAPRQHATIVAGLDYRPMPQPKSCGGFRRHR